MTFAEKTREYKFYYFSSPSDYNKGIDWDGKKVNKSKYKDFGLRVSENAIPTKYRSYGKK